MVKPANLAREPQEREELPISQSNFVVKGGNNSIVFSNFQDTRTPSVKIIDIRQSLMEMKLSEDILKGLQEGPGKKTLPTMLLYDEAGLKEFEAITYVEDYYLTNAEIEVLTANAEDIAARVPDGALLVELGSGNLRKVNILLQALESAKKRVDYFALDLSRPELQRTFSKLPNGGFQFVRCYGLHGTYDDGRKWLQDNQEIKDRPRFILWLGSSIGNYEPEEAAAFLSDWRREVIRPGSQDRMLVAFDHCNDAERVYFAYNDREGVTERFIMNGLKNANSILGKSFFNLDNWEYFGEYDIINDRHQASYLAKTDVKLDLSNPVHISKGEKIRVERSYKFSDANSSALFEKAGLCKGAAWGQEDGDYTLHLLYNPISHIPLDPTKYASGPYPLLDEWKSLWDFWDLASLRMIRKDQYQTKPISLRNPIIFYTGHIPTFLDVQLSKVTKVPLTEPRWFADIFQRGIDPDVDDPTQCHNHSDIPKNWPELDVILEYQTRVRKRVEGIYKDGEAAKSVKLQQALWLGFEHEVMHLETLLYMLLQHNLTIPPAGVPTPDFRSMYLLDIAKNLEGEEWMKIAAQEIVLGVDNRDDEGGHFGWDNERPPITKSVAAFEAFSRPITNGEYVAYMVATGVSDLPKSWTRDSRNITQDTIAELDPSIATNSSLKGLFVKTVFGPVPMTYAQHWPITAAFDEINGCAKWMGGRLPTREELQVIYGYTETLKKDKVIQKLAAMIDAVNGHLSMDGVHISPPPPASEIQPPADEKAHSGQFANLNGANVSFRHWHPSSVKNRICGRGDGGLWEWTSTVLERWDGFKPLDLYPEYTADFFDGKHNFVLGGSWATHSRIAGRKSFVNWYQRAYQYAWCTARIVRDTKSD